MKRSPKHSPEVHECTVRMVRRHPDEATISAIASKISCRARRAIEEAERKTLLVNVQALHSASATGNFHFSRSNSLVNDSLCRIRATMLTTISA